jgi:hypothetical protein
LEILSYIQYQIKSNQVGDWMTNTFSWIFTILFHENLFFAKWLTYEQENNLLFYFKKWSHIVEIFGLFILHAILIPFQYQIKSNQVGDWMTNTFSWIFTILFHENIMPIHSDILSWFQANQSLLFVFFMYRFYPRSILFFIFFLLFLFFLFFLYFFYFLQSD